jgi:hypothetical protein
MLSESGRRDGRGGRSAKSVRHIHQTLHKAFDDAVSLRYLRTNPAFGAKPPLVATRSDSLRDWIAAELRAFPRERHDHRHLGGRDLRSTGVRRSRRQWLRELT